MQNFSKEELILQIKDLQEQLQKIKKQKKYGIVWEEKAENIDKNKLPMLEEDKELRIENDKNKPQNLIIEWDNFHALSVLQNTHKGKIDMIYIDPPYNTGNKDFIYNDDYVDKEDSYRHSKWLSFMKKRLALAKNLLKDDGVIFISIDDNEFAQLKLLCDEIFGERNFVDCISWDKKSSAKWVPPVNMIVNVHEYILVYQNSENFAFLWEARSLDWFSNPDNDIRWPWRNTNIKSTIKSADENFSIIDPETWNIFTDTWAFSKKELERLIEEKYLIFPKNENWQVRRKEFFYEFKNQNIPIKSSWGLFDNQKNTEMLKSMFWWNIFNNPKPLNLLKYLLKVTSKQNSIILDFFAGSGTTGHAVMELNKEDGWNRQFILCSNKENTKENPEKNICRDITYERNKRVIQGYTNAKWEQIEGLGGNLRYYKTTFINKNPSIDDLRYSFIHKCDDLLCIRENTFTKVSFGEEIEEIKIFHNKNHFTVILYDMLYFAKAKEILELFPDKKISFYAFSMSKTMITEEIAHIWKNIVLENIPDEILETYEKIFGL